MRALAPVLAASCFLGLASLAFAAEIDRAEYKAAVEPICQRNATANERILKGVRGLVKQGKLKLAAAKFAKAAEALRRAHNQLKAVPQPTADEARLAKWLRYIRIEADLFRSAGLALKAGNKPRASRLVNKLNRNANLANATVLAFNFRHCRFEPSKFT